MDRDRATKRALLNIIVILGMLICLIAVLRV